MKIPSTAFAPAARPGALVGLAVALGACSNEEAVTVAGYPYDYRQRHPIAIQEADAVDCHLRRPRAWWPFRFARADVIGLAKSGCGKEPAPSMPMAVDTPTHGPPRIRSGNSVAARGGRGAASRIIVRRYHPETRAGWQRSG